MRIIVNILLVFLFLIVMPFGLGISFERIFNREKKSENICIPRCLVMGAAIMLALFQMIAVPMIVIGTSFHILVISWTITAILCTVLSIWINRKRIALCVSNVASSFTRLLSEHDREYVVTAGAALLLIVFETCLMIFRTHMDTDDSRFIAEAMEAYERDTMLRVHPITGAALDFPISEMRKDVTSPYPLFIAVIATLVRIHPAILAHAVLPALLIPLSYMTAYLLVDIMLADRRKVPTCMLVLAMVVLFSFESDYAWGNVMLGIIWQGRSFMAVIMLPFLWYLFVNLLKADDFSKGMYVAILITGLACIDLSGMGGIMAPIIGGTFALAYLIIKRKLLPALTMALCVIPAGIYMIMYKFF